MTPFLSTWDAARYPTAYLRLGYSEAQVQTQVLRALAQLGHLAVPVDAGAKHLRGRAIGALRRQGFAHPEALLRGRTGTLAGLVDVVGCMRDGRGLFIEVKRPVHLVPSKATPGRFVQADAPGAPTEAQLRFLEAAHRRGAVVGVVWAARDLEVVLGGRVCPVVPWDAADERAELASGKDLSVGPA